jgi:hypothetical protein
LEPFPNEAARQFVINGIDNYNIAITGEAVHYPANFFKRSSRRGSWRSPRTDLGKVAVRGSPSGGRTSARGGARAGPLVRAERRRS